jgi:hypothetical protein
MRTAYKPRPKRSTDQPQTPLPTNIVLLAATRRTVLQPAPGDSRQDITEQLWWEPVQYASLLGWVLSGCVVETALHQWFDVKSSALISWNI